MSGKSVFSKNVVGLLSLAMVTTAIAPQAMAQERQGRQQREDRSSGATNGNRGSGWSDSGVRGGERGRDFRQQQSQARTPSQQVQSPPYQAQVQQRSAVPQRGWDGTRWNGTNPGRDNGADVRQTDRRDSDRNWNRDGNRDRNGTTANGTWNGRNQGYANQDRNRDYRDRNDGPRDGWNSNNSRGNWNSNGWRGYNGRNAYQGDYRRWSNDWRRDNRYDWGRYRAANRGIYRLPRYNSPFRGYSYSRLSIGVFLNSGFYGNNYWINDPWAYRLPPAYGPYRWVRYWNDVLLVDIYTGEVVDVIDNFFW